MGVPIEYNQTRAYNINIRSMKLHDQDIFLWRQNWVMVLVNIYYLFTYLSVFVDDGSRWNLGITALISWLRIAPLRWVVILFFLFLSKTELTSFFFLRLPLVCMELENKALILLPHTWTFVKVKCAELKSPLWVCSITISVM